MYPLLVSNSANMFPSAPLVLGAGPAPMAAFSVDTERGYDDDQFRTVPIHKNDRVKAVLGYFAPGQFIPVHAPESDVVVHVHAGRGRVRDSDVDRRVGPGDVVVVEAGTDRGIRADDDTHLDALLVTSPPPSDAEHEPVRRGIRDGVFDPAEDD